MDAPYGMVVGGFVVQDACLVRTTKSSSKSSNKQGSIIDSNKH
jgi:hypothetical protein